MDAPDPGAVAEEATDPVASGHRPVLGDLLSGPDAGIAGLLSMLVLSTVSMVASGRYRRRIRRQTAARLAARLARVVGPRA